MNKKGGSILASKFGFYIVFILLFSLSLVYALKLIERTELTDVKFDEIEKKVMVNRVISCLSGDNFGEIDINKFNEFEVRKCFPNNDFNLRVLLDNGVDPKRIVLGDITQGKSTGRFVLVDGERARLGVSYLKDVS